MPRLELSHATGTANTAIHLASPFTADCPSAECSCRYTYALWLAEILMDEVGYCGYTRSTDMRGNQRLGTGRRCSGKAEYMSKHSGNVVVARSRTMSCAMMRIDKSPSFADNYSGSQVVPTSQLPGQACRYSICEVALRSGSGTSSALLVGS